MTQQRTTAKKSSRLAGFFSDAVSELKKVVWLSRRELFYLTLIVLIVSIITGLFLGGLDYGFTALVNKFFITK